MDDSPSAADSQPGLLPPYPFRAPDGEQRLLPDAMAIRIVAVPDSCPPFDDELPAARNPPGRGHQIWAAQPGSPAPAGTNSNDELATGHHEPCSATADEPRTTSHHGDEGPARDDQPASGRESAGTRRPRGNPGKGRGSDAGQWPSQFAQVLAETLAGARPASQLTPWTTERARAHIRRLGPLLAADRPPRVQRVRASQPAKNVVEVAVIAEFGCRTRALAARLERAEAQPASPGRPGREARWLCTAIESA